MDGFLPERLFRHIPDRASPMEWITVGKVFGRCPVCATTVEHRTKQTEKSTQLHQRLRLN